MKMRSFEAPIIEAWATWECLRKLGFASDDIFWIFEKIANAVPRPGLVLNIVLKAQDKRFAVTCSPRLSEGEARRTEASARKFHETLASGQFDEAEMTELLHASWVWKNKADLMMALIGKGFVFPYRLN